MKPEVQAILRKSGVIKEPHPCLGDPESIQEKLTAAGLGLDDILENLAGIANSSGNEALRLSATRDALKMHGVLKENQPAAAMPSFTIIINDKEGAAVSQIQGENPIFLPRQLLKQLSVSEDSKTAS